ncbi:integral membrane sensor signal transduction histidine kinase [Emticicia oligotrophica DSM 17448]|uniref:histidine kinase n=1 Tax=Emticicia oligotrophica (strain DSM 17448 / CIP 109782 / MTCC 6937 / GPTSA100-15) TaxID=929562 RepID=A0ABM5N692_EMTOG|nr:HAMP domain-containing sensor histidine kinase [Emticicia oligotrophica]AFK04911.1 integral membrane sensor signal transduction histidine kinase [Emticicia oligotrophica DSM 17448]
MKIVDKQTIRIPTILSVALIIFSANIYLFYSNFRENEFYLYLRNNAISIEKMIIDKGLSGEDVRTMDDMKENIYTQEQFIIYDSTGTVIFKSRYAVNHLTDNLLKEVYKHEVEFKKDGYERTIFLSRNNKYKRLLVIEAAGYDLSGFNKQRNLLYILIISSVLLISIITLTTRYYIRTDLRPIGEIAKRMKKISSKNLQSRIPEADLDNEIGQMAHTFNDLLDRLDNSYTQQRNFVSYVTHELRTPLSILLGNAQVTLMKERTVEEYKQTVENFQVDINNMINLVNSLLELARMNADAQSVPFVEVRVDEVLWAASDIVKKNQPEYHINVEFEQIPENDEQMIVSGNAELLVLVFRNLMENACKYSADKRVEAKILYEKNSIRIDFIDKGVGMSSSETEHIFEPFYRNEKTKEISGHGIGLPLTKRIVEIHSGKISVLSEEGVGSIFTVELPVKQLY